MTYQGLFFALCGLLGIIFVVLKFLKVLTWSWWIILMPIYGPPITLMLITIVFVLLTHDCEFEL